MPFLPRTVKLIGKTVGYSKNIVSNTAEIAVVAPDRRVGAPIKSIGIPSGKKMQIKERMDHLRIEIAELERKMGARTAANVNVATADPADDEETRTWMEEID